MPPKPTAIYLLAGLLRCANCGMRAVSRFRGRQYHCGQYFRVRRAGTAGRGCRSYIGYARPLESALIKRVTSLLSGVLAIDIERFAEAWEPLRRPGRQAAERQRQVDRRVLTAQRRLRREAEMLTDARLDANGYELVCRHADADLRAAMAEGDAIQMTTRGGLHPPARTTRANVEAWLEALLHRHLRAKRAALESLLYSLEVERVGFARFTATVQWTPIGAALQAVVRRCGGVAQ